MVVSMCFGVLLYFKMFILGVWYLFQCISGCCCILKCLFRVFDCCFNVFGGFGGILKCFFGCFMVVSMSFFRGCCSILKYLLWVFYVCFNVFFLLLRYFKMFILGVSCLFYCFVFGCCCTLKCLFRVLFVCLFQCFLGAVAVF